MGPGALSGDASNPRYVKSAHLPYAKPAGPDHPDFRLGKTLGRHYGNWRRVRRGLPERYRLFFRFASKPVKLIVCVWLNDEDTLRKAGSKTDVHETFRRMLARGEVPGSIDHLLRESRKSG